MYAIGICVFGTNDLFSQSYHFRDRPVEVPGLHMSRKAVITYTHMFVLFVKYIFQDSHAWILYSIENKFIYIYVANLSKARYQNQTFGMKLCLDMTAALLEDANK